jgi:NADPH:quinone reductase-like Zn-dependent oxidoreductase
MCRAWITGEIVMKLRYKITAVIFLFFALSIAALALVISHTEDCGPAQPYSGDSATMKAVIYRCYGSPDVLEVTEIEKPVPAADEVLVRVEAAAVNPLDWHYMRGTPYIVRLLGSGLGAPTNPRIGVDFAGTIEAVGSEVTRFRPGDDVFGGATGAFAEYVTVNAERAVVHKPANISFEQAASVTIAGTTALQALRDTGKLEAGQKVLINGASGGVGTFAVQIAKALGAEVTGVCSTRNLDLVRSIGSDHVFDYTREDYTKSDRRFDVIIDMVGNHGLLANRDVMTPAGIYVGVGGTVGNWVGPLTGPLKAMALTPFVSQEFTGFLAQLRQEDLLFLADLMAQGKLVPVTGSRFSLDEVPEAIRLSEGGHARGKIIVTSD